MPHFRTGGVTRDDDGGERRFTTPAQTKAADGREGPTESRGRRVRGARSSERLRRRSLGNAESADAEDGAGRPTRPPSPGPEAPVQEAPHARGFDVKGVTHPCPPPPTYLVYVTGFSKRKHFL